MVMKRRSFDQCRARFISRACRADLSGVTRTKPQTVASTDKTDTSCFPQRLGSLEHRGEQTRESEHQRSEEEIPRSPFPSLSCAFNAVGATDNNISIDLFRSFERNRAIIFRAQPAKISNRRHIGSWQPSDLTLFISVPSNRNPPRPTLPFCPCTAHWFLYLHRFGCFADLVFAADLDQRKHTTETRDTLLRRYDCASRATHHSSF